MYRSVFATPLRHPFLSSAIIAAVLALASVGEFTPEFDRPADWAISNLTTGSVSRANLLASESAETGTALPLPGTMDLAALIGRAREWLAPAGEPDEALPFESAVATTDDLLRTLVPEHPIIVLPEVEPVSVEPLPTVVHEPTDEVPQAAEGVIAASTLPPSPAATRANVIDRDLFVAKGEEMLARGDVGGARMFFEPAAESGDARAAAGMAQTFDANVLRTLRVYGVRGDAERAAYWYTRANEFERAQTAR